MDAGEFDQRFDRGDDITAELDLTKARRPGREEHQADVESPVRMIDDLDRRSHRAAPEGGGTMSEIDELLAKEGSAAEDYEVPDPVPPELQVDRPNLGATHESILSDLAADGR